MPSRREVLSQWPKQLHVLATALDEQQPRPMVAHDVVVEADAADDSSRHP